MAAVDPPKAIEAITKARPPETDRFTYLAVIQANICVEVLPTLNHILQDAPLCQDLGWDLVYDLCRLPGADACLETIARLGNPREVILKVLETLELLEELRGQEQGDGDGDGDDGDGSGGGGGEDGDNVEDGDNDGKEKKRPSPRVSNTDIFITLLGMLAILHRRIRTRFPSRFLAQTLKTVYASYRPDQPGMTAAVLNLVHSLSGGRRPPLPTRKSSVSVANPDQDGDASKNAPDPEADSDYHSYNRRGVASPSARNSTDEELAEDARQQRLLLCFVTCILEAYVDGNDMAWAARLVEFYNPHKIPSLRRTMMAAFREDKELAERDAMVGKLVALTRDLGLVSCPEHFLAQLCTGSIDKNPLSQLDEAPTTGAIALSTGGCVCLLAYWVFSSTLFDAGQPVPTSMHIFPQHFAILSNFLRDQNAELHCALAPGVAQAVISIGLWLHAENHIVAAPSLSRASTSGKEQQQQHQQQQQQQQQQDEQQRLDHEPAPHEPAEPATATAEKQTLPSSDFMRYLHLLTLLTIYHPILRVRDAGVTLAGLVLHADPADEDRLRILDDLLENCVFPKLKACAVTWLREEFLLQAAPAVKKAKDADGPQGQEQQHQSAFAGPQAFETVQYSLFPNLRHLDGLPSAELEEYLGENMAFLLQVANLGLFLFGSRGGRSSSSSRTRGEKDGAAGRDGEASRSSGTGGGGGGSGGGSGGSGGGSGWAHVLPPNAEATMRERWLEPLRAACRRVEEETAEARGEGGRQSLHALLEGPGDGGLRLGLEILSNCLDRLARPSREGAGTAGGAE